MQSSYLKEVLDPLKAKRTVDEIVETLQEYVHLFDAIAFRGSSGLLVGPSVAMALNKGMILVRKEEPNDGHHSPYKVEGTVTAKTYIVIDDLVATGATLQAIKDDIDLHTPNKPRYMGTVLYYHNVRIYDWED